MISPELTVRIRNLFYAEHWKIGTIAAELGVHWDTVRSVIESDRFNKKPDSSFRQKITDCGFR
jgi:DNA-binding transcriptional regulator LsrR (DeoR family)